MSPYLEELKKGFREAGSMYWKGGALQYQLRYFVCISIIYEFFLKTWLVPKSYRESTLEWWVSLLVIYFIANDLSIRQTQRENARAKSRGDESGTDR